MKQPPTKLLVAAGLLVALAIALAGARGHNFERPPIHLNPNMDQQPKYRAQAASDFFYDGATMRQPVEGAVARGKLWEDGALYSGFGADGAHVQSNPLAVDETILQRGEERYGIFCTPCHAASGNGRGVLYERAGIESGNLHDPRIVAMPDGEIFDVITNGVGLMAGYRYPISPEDRWAIVAYVRQMQAGGAG